MEIDSNSVVNSDEALAMLDKLRVFFEERNATSLTKKAKKMRTESKKQKNITYFFK